MTKKGPLGKAEVFYIESFYDEKTPQEIAKDLDRAVSSVKKEVERIVGENPPESLTAGDKFARREGVVMMTESASAAADENRKTSDNSSSDCISRIKRDG